MALCVVGCDEPANAEAQALPECGTPAKTSARDPALTHLASPPQDPRAAINTAIQEGRLVDTGDELALLQDMLRVAGVPEASQVLVFSLTSHQDHLISRTNPRAIYFSDDAYIGFVPRGIIEYSDVDPDKGTGFFVLDNKPDKPMVLRDTESCLICHEGGRVNYDRGLMVRSVFVRENGFPYTSAGSFDVSHDTPMEHRWGGWYVTGEHGKIRHMGNVVASEPEQGQRPAIDREAGANITDLSDYFDQSKYPVAGSDIVALMVLEHQVVMHNLLTQGGLKVREQAERSQKIAESLGEPFDPSASETLQIVINSRAEKILKHMLFVEEIALDNPISGNPAFIEQFRANRREDPAGRSLKDFDLHTRMFEHRCSYMIYSRAFREMPELLQDAVYARLSAGLQAASSDELFKHLDADERAAIDHILRETHAGYAAHVNS